MRIGEICTRDVVFCAADTSIADAARLMRERHVGDLVVGIEGSEGVRPIGIVTDRDIVVEVVAMNVSPDQLAVKDIMSRALTYVDESKGVYETLALMRHKGIRRMPVVDERDDLVGIVTFDDLLEGIAEETGLAAKLIQKEREQETIARPAKPARG
jgi:signal-transduction protein with cAMP-binding, CBS, and nucleotidyltransferase domain